MKAILFQMKPTPLALLMLALIFLAQWIHFSGTYTTYDYEAEGQPPNGSVSYYGTFSPVVVTTLHGDSTVDVGGGWLGANLVLSYGLAVLLSAFFARCAQNLKRPEQLYGAAAATMVVASFLLSITWSKSYWGYYLFRPGVLAAVDDFSSVDAIVPLEMEVEGNNPRSIGLNTDYDLTESLAHATEEPYYALDERLLIALREKGQLPEVPATSLDDLPELYPLVVRSGLIAPAEVRYAKYENLWGVAIDGRNAGGERMLILGLSGGQVSNDHYPYYELLFMAPAGTSAFTYVRGQRFFYDNAGIEGVEWYTLWFILLIPAIVIGLLATALVLAIREISRRLRFRAELADSGILDSRLRWRVATVLMPTPLRLAMFVLVLLIQCAFYVLYPIVQSGGAPLGGPIGEAVVSAIDRLDDATVRVLYVLALAADLFISYVVAALLARSYRSATGSRRPGQLFAWSAAVVLAVTFLASIGFSRYYWGYYLFRPPVLSAIHDVASVVSVVPFEADPYDDVNSAPLVPDNYQLSRKVAACANRSYYCLPERLLLPLNQRGMLPAAHSTALSELPPATDLIRDSGLFAAPDEGYTHTGPFRGVYVEARSASGGRMLFLGAACGEVSNDHRPYYELHFTAPPGTDDWAFAGGQRFFFDIAGNEGIEWYVVWPFLAVAAMGLCLPAACAWGVVWHSRKGWGKQCKKDAVPAETRNRDDKRGGSSAGGLVRDWRRSRRVICWVEPGLLWRAAKWPGTH